jgi:carboxyl-terminal processing protease
MQNFLNFMKRNKGLLVLIVVAFGCLFFAFTNSGHKDGGSLEQRKKLLAAIGSLLEEQHYSPKSINDNFSKQVYKRFLEAMDGEKNLFTQADINSFKKYETSIDDEIHGSEIKFAPAVSAVYDKRIAEAEAFYKELLAQPFDFTANEDFVTDGDKLDYCKDEKEMKERWRKKLKYLTLERFADMQDQREKLHKDSLH